MTKYNKLLKRNSKKKYKGGSFLLPGAQWKSKRLLKKKNIATNRDFYDLKHMSTSKINKIYSEIDKEKIEFSFDCKIMGQEDDREMVEITAINRKKLLKKLVFFKSTGESRLTFAGTNSNTKNIWFPCDDICISPMSKRITKAENRYLSINNNLSNQLKLETKGYTPKNNQPFLNKYGRFINKQNAIISNLLGKGIKCAVKNKSV
jgi:hypothetical protein